MSYPETITVGEGRDWEYSKKAGFLHKVWITVDFVYRSDAGIEAPWDTSGWDVKKANAAQFFDRNSVGPNRKVGTWQRTQTKDKLTTQLNELIGGRKQEWRTNSYRGEEHICIFTKDLHWILLAKLAGYLSLVEAICRVETLDSNEAIS